MQSQVVEAPGTTYKSTSVARLSTMWAYRTALCVLVLSSLGLRLFGIGWGIPNFDPGRVAASAYRNSYHIDEDNFIWGLMQMHPAAGNFDVLDYHWGTLQFYLIYGTLLGGEVTGILPSPWENAFRAGDIAALPKIYILGRLLSVAAGVIGTLIVLALGTLLAGRAAGLAAGVAYAVAPLAVTESHYLTNDIVMSVFVAGSVLCAVLAVKGGVASSLRSSQGGYPLGAFALRLPVAGPSLVVLVAVASLGASVALNKVFVIRYSQPLLPLLAVAAGVAWAAIPLAWLRWGAGAIALAVASVITLGQLSIMAGPHPANDLLAWLQSHLQPGQTVAQIWPEYPPLDGGSYKLIHIDPWNPQLPAGARPDYIIMDNMAFAPPSPALAGLLTHDYYEVASFSVQPHIGPFAWDEGVTPHDWKYSHPTFTVYAPTSTP